MLRTVWDSLQDAQEFFDLQRSVLLKRFPAQEEAGKPEKEASKQVAWQSGPLQSVGAVLCTLTRAEPEG
ncbi:MAG: hypothetical protein V3T83_11370 [Acidobacteriota bacterium]